MTLAEQIIHRVEAQGQGWHGYVDEVGPHHGRVMAITVAAPTSWPLEEIHAVHVAVMKLVNKFAYLGKVKLVSMVDLMVICMSSFRWNQVTSLNGMAQPFIISSISISFKQL